MKETHQPRAPTVPRTGRPNREPLDVDEVIAYGLALAEDLGVSIPKHRRLRRMLKRRIPIPQIYQGRGLPAVDRPILHRRSASCG